MWCLGRLYVRMPTSSETAGKDDDVLCCRLDCGSVPKRVVNLCCCMEENPNSSDGWRWCFCLVIALSTVHLAVRQLL